MDYLFFHIINGLFILTYSKLWTYIFIGNIICIIMLSMVPRINKILKTTVKILDKIEKEV